MPLRTIRPPSTVGAAWLTLQARASAKWAGWSICETVAAGGCGWEVWLLSTACAARWLMRSRRMRAGLGELFVTALSRFAPNGILAALGCEYAL